MAGSTGALSSLCPGQGSAVPPAGIRARRLRAVSTQPLIWHGAAQILQPPPDGWEAWMGEAMGEREGVQGRGLRGPALPLPGEYHPWDAQTGGLERALSAGCLCCSCLLAEGCSLPSQSSFSCSPG